jgi:acetyl-CoA C-acetyltransferase
MKKVFIVGAARTAIGDFGGVFRPVSAVDLMVPTMKAAISRASLTEQQIGKVILGNTLSPLDPNIARIASIASGIPKDVPSFSIHAACASGMQALISGASALALGEAEMALVGGVESMSNAPYISPSARWGQRLRHTQNIDLLWWCMQEAPVMGGVGQVADALAKELNITREEQDELAYTSHARAVNAQREGHYTDQIIPIAVKNKQIATDEHPRADTTLESLRTLPPAFSKDGTVTPGNSSAINDGAAAIVLATEKACKENGLKPLASVGAWSIVAREPRYVGLAPVGAIRNILAESRLSLADIDLIEMNEAFAAFYLACEKEMKLDRSKVNVNGSGISLGHPVGATGARITITLLYEMMRRDAALGISSLCAGGGMGYAILLRRDF